MRYDVYLEIGTGASETADVYWANHTSNTAPMWRHAGADLAELAGKTAAEIAPVLTAAIERMAADPDTYEAMNPANGWGSYESTLEFLRGLRDACRDHPATSLRVSR